MIVPNTASPRYSSLSLLNLIPLHVRLQLNGGEMQVYKLRDFRE